MRTAFLLVLAVATAGAAPAAAQQPAQASARPQALADVIDCRQLAEPAARLACFDRTVAALDQAESSRALVVMEREQLRRTRRSLFGLTLPNLNVFGDDQEDQEAVSEINSTIRAVTQDALGKWIFTLEDGARWAQLDSRDLARTPRPGQPIRIRRAAMGSYLANVNNQIAIRVRRDR
jgi:hypothetical protein